MDGSHIIFVNGQYHNNSNDIGKLMHDFRCTDSNSMNYPVLAEKVNYFKNTKGGGKAMCKMMEEMRKEAAEEAANEKAKTNAIAMLKDNVPIEKVSLYSGLPKDEIQKIKEKNNL